MSRRPPTFTLWEWLLFCAALTCLFLLIFIHEPLQGAPS